MYEVIGIKIESKTNETKSFFTNHLSMNQLNEKMYNQGYELDEQTTLEQYLDHKWVDEHIIEIVNDRAIMDCPLSKLLTDYAIYNMTFDAKVKN